MWTKKKLIEKDKDLKKQGTRECLKRKIRERKSNRTLSKNSKKWQLSSTRKRQTLTSDLREKKRMRRRKKKKTLSLTMNSLKELKAFSMRKLKKKWA